MTMVFLPASDISKYVAAGNVDIGVTGIDIVEENGLEVERVMNLGFGKCRLCVQAPVASNITDIKSLAGKRIVTSFPSLTKKFFEPLDKELGVETSIQFLSGSVEAACGLGLADAVVDLVETGTTMKVRIEDENIFPDQWSNWEAMCVRFAFFAYRCRLTTLFYWMNSGCWIGSRGHCS